MDFTEAERNTLINSLRVAAERFNEHAKMLSQEAAGMPGPNSYDRLADQFRKQASDSLALAHRIETDGE